MLPNVLLLFMTFVHGCNHNKAINHSDIINRMELFFEHRIKVLLFTGERLEMNMLEEPFKSNCSTERPGWVQCLYSAQYIRLLISVNVGF